MQQVTEVWDESTSPHTTLWWPQVPDEERDTEIQEGSVLTINMQQYKVTLLEGNEEVLRIFVVPI